MFIRLPAYPYDWQGVFSMLPDKKAGGRITGTAAAKVAIFLSVSPVLPV